ncbi:MAG: hypothetical protein ACLUA4_01135 [Bifidobacterium sp.]
MLEKLFTSDSFEMVVLYGRRRVGKTALIDEFVKDKRVLYFTAIQQSAKIDLEDFSRAALASFLWYAGFHTRRLAGGLMRYRLLLNVMLHRLTNVWCSYSMSSLMQLPPSQHYPPCCR